MSVRIVEGGEGDVPRIMAVMRTAFAPDFGEAWSAVQCANMLALPGTCLLIAEDDDVAGFALLRRAADEVELLLIAVDPEHRRCGVGRALIEHVLKWGRANDAAALFLEVRDGNPATALYRDVAFIQVGRRPNYYRGAQGVLFDALTFRRAIGP